MQVALVYPPSTEERLKGYPLGLAYLSAVLKQANHQVDIYDYNGKSYHKSLKDFFKIIKITRPDLLAISFNSFNRAGAYQIINVAKKIKKDIFVVLGGVHPATLPEQMFKYFYDAIDFIVRSEGEQTLPALCNALENKSSYKEISGLVYKDRAKGIVNNPVPDIVENLDQLPIPDFSYAAEYIKKKGLAFLITSRGCPANCIFCSTSSFWGQKIRMYSPERVGQEVEFLKCLGAKRLFFHDDTFNLGIERTLKITEILKKMDVEYVIQCRVKPINEEIIKKLAESGCKHISWGMESLSDQILKKINKNITKEEVKKAFDLCANYTDKFTTSGYCCVGIPGETEETVNQTVEYMNKNIKSTHGAGASMLYILPGTPLYYQLLEKGEFNPDIWVKSDAVYYYTKEHNMNTLNQWRKRVNRSGIRIPFSTKYFWDSIPTDEVINKETPFTRKINKILKKIKRQCNFMRNRY